MLQLTKDNFEAEVLRGGKPALVDFWAPWCGPCRMFAPALEAAAAELPGVTVGKVNTDEEGELAERYGVMSIPTLILFRGGEAVKRSTGALSKEETVAFAQN